MDVKINDNSGSKSPYYVYFLDSPDLQSSNTHFKRYCVATNEIDKYFPNLVDRNWYRPDTLYLDKEDSYIGMMANSNIARMTAIILPSELNKFEYNYKYAYITDSTATDLSLIFDDWLYYIDFSDITNVNISYVVEFIESDTSTTTEDAINGVIVNYHEYDSVAHNEDILYFPSDKNSDSLMSKDLAKFISGAYYHTKNSVRVSGHSGNMHTLGATLNLTTNEYKDTLNGFSEEMEIEDNERWYNELINHWKIVRKGDYDYGNE